MSRNQSDTGCCNVPVDPSALFIDKKKIAVMLGYGERALPEHFESMIDELLGELPGYCEIRAGYRIFDIDRQERNDGCLIAGTFFTTREIIASQLKRASRAALFACTIGPQVERWSSRLFGEGDPVSAHFIDTIASAAVEAVADILHDVLQTNMAKQGMFVTNRFSPGYCGWLVSEQHLLFGYLPADFCGIRVTDSALMIPMKSVSGLIGIGVSVKRENYHCDRCARKDCTYKAYTQMLNKKGETS